MGATRGKRRKKKRSGKHGRGVEWLGGRFTAPFFVEEGGPHRPEITLWLELPSGFLLATSLSDPSAPEIPFAETLRRTMEAPMVGEPRKPSRVRVASEALASEVLEAFPEIEVVALPTPELDEVFEDLAGSLVENAGDEASYLEGGRISAEAVEKLFRAARTLWASAPWKSAEDHQVLRVDIPAFGVVAGCLSIIGALGESLGFLIFPSLDSHEAFGSLAESGIPPSEPLDLGTSVLSLTFSRGADLPDRMRREIAEHDWPVAGPDAYPVVEHRDRDGFPRPLTEKDVRIASACATSLIAFLMKHESIFRKSTFDPICESWFDEEDLEVRFTVPYEAGPLFEVNDPGPAAPVARKTGESRPKVPRNAPCPCGSGKKYKKCCLGKDEAVEEEERPPASLHEMDGRLAAAIVRFAARRFGPRWIRRDVSFGDVEEAAQLSVPWSIYDVPVEGKTAAEWFREERGRSLSEEERGWLDAQRSAWLTIWEAEEVRAGESARLRDLLSGEERLVTERTATVNLAVRDALLARVVDLGGFSLLSGMHPRSLPPREADRVATRVRKRLRRKRAVPVDRLRDEKIGRYLIRCWEEEAEELDRRRAIPPRITNTDGEELLLTADHFEFDLADRGEIEKRLASLEGVEPPDRDERERVYVFLRPSGGAKKPERRTVLGRAVVAEGRLRLETNSRERADSLRGAVEMACGELLRHRLREQTDPLADLGESEDEGDKPGEGPAAEGTDLLLDYKERYYEEWLDLPVPALDGRTPRESVRTKDGRRRASLLLKEMENMEHRLPEEERFDFGKIRRRLGLE